MLNRQPGMHRRSVWVLMFESLSLEFDREFVSDNSAAGTEMAPEIRSNADDHGLADDEAKVTARKGYTAFEDLDMSSAFFEQYLIQDARRGITVADVLGGEEAVRHFQQLLSQHSCRMANVVLSKANQQADIDADSPHLTTFASHAITLDIALNSASELSEALSEQVLANPGFQDADLVWVDVRNSHSRQDPAWPALISRAFIELRRRLFSDPAEEPILIVSSMRGSSRAVAPPFVAGCEESLIHVPLWIDDGNGHSRRLQKLAGSFDLLPTLADYLTGEPGDERSRIPPVSHIPGAAEAASTAAAGLAVGPRSLRSMLNDFDCESDRLLNLVGDGWNALRSQQYLLVSAELLNIESETVDSGLDRRRLYLKPDDVWNVHDSIVTYAAVADEMDAVWQRRGE